MFRYRRCIRERKRISLVVDPLQPAAGVIEANASAPTKRVERRTAVRAIQLRGKRTVPRLAIVRRINDVRVPVLIPQECGRTKSKAATSVGVESDVRQPLREEILAALIVITQRRR